MSKDENSIDRLLDVDDDEPVTLYDANDNGIKFEQHALIPYKEKLYAILKPIDKIDGVEDDQGIIFEFSEDEKGEPTLLVVSDDKIIDAVFGIYLKMIAEEEGESKTKKQEKPKTSLKEKAKSGAENKTANKTGSDKK